MSKVKVTFDQCLKALKSFLEKIKKPDGKPNVKEAKDYLKRLKEICIELQKFYFKVITSASPSQGILNTQTSKSRPRQKKTKTINIDGMTFDECLEELKDILDDVNEGKKPDIEKAEKCLKRLNEIYNYLVEPIKCQDTITRIF